MWAGMMETIGSPYFVIVHFGIRYVYHPVSLVICPYRIYSITCVMCVVMCSIYYPLE